jgi:hypothetical protein
MPGRRRIRVNLRDDEGAEFVVLAGGANPSDGPTEG